MTMVYNFYLIISFSDSSFDQMLTLCDIEDPIFVFSDVRDLAFRKDQRKGMENLVSRVEYIVVVQNIGNTKHKTLENLIGNKYASINVAIAPENGFVDETI